MDTPISSVEIPFWDGDLEAAAYLCLEKAALTDRDQFPPGSGDAICRIFHNRRRRFQEAEKKRVDGPDSLSLLELGLSAEDCAWAAEQANRAIDPGGWKLRFTTARDRLKAATPEQKDSATT